MFTYSRFIHHYTKSTFNHKEPISQDFTVTVNGEAVPVYTCRTSRYPFNRVWPGYQRPGDQTQLASFVNLISDEPLQITVKIHCPHKRVLLKPYSKAIGLKEENDTVTFTLPESGQFVLEADSYRHSLYIFNSKPIPEPKEEEVTYFFGPGVHFPGKITLHSNESVYVHKDALVFGCLYAENAENIHIFGNGLFDDSGEGRVSIHCYENYTNGNLKFFDCKNLRIEGILCRDSAIWCVNLFHCFDVVLDGIKVFGQWRYNTDGVDIVNSQDIVVKNSFIHSFDDSLVIKAIDRYAHTDNRNILVENCVLWCDWGKTCELGIETYCREYRDITFRNCDILRAGHFALCTDNGETAEMSNILFEDIRVEYNGFDTVPVYQESEDMIYDKEDEISIPVLIYVTNVRWHSDENDTLWDISPKLLNPLDFTGTQPAGIHDVTFRKIRVHYDESIPMAEDGRFQVPISVKSHVKGVRFYNITVSDVQINGIPVTADNVLLDVNDTDNFVLE